MSKINIQTIGGSAGHVFDDVVSEASQDMKDIAYGLRGLLAEVMPGITEVPWPKQKTAGYGVGAKKMSEHFCYIAPQKEHVNLGFFYGAALDDPEGLLEGSGKLLRHIKIRTLDDVARPALRVLVTQASGYLPKLK